MEMLTVYDKNRRPTGKTIERGSALSDGEFHIVVHVSIINSEGQMLIQQRQPFKDEWPDLWDLSIGGTATAGEDSVTTAERELLEELGYKADLSDTRAFFTINFSDGFDDYYILKDNVDVKSLKLQY